MVYLDFMCGQWWAGRLHAKFWPRSRIFFKKHNLSKKGIGLGGVSERVSTPQNRGVWQPLDPNSKLSWRKLSVNKLMSLFLKDTKRTPKFWVRFQTLNQWFTRMGDFKCLNYVSVLAGPGYLSCGRGSFVNIICTAPLLTICFTHNTFLGVEYSRFYVEKIVQSIEPHRVQAQSET